MKHHILTPEERTRLQSLWNTILQKESHRTRKDRDQLCTTILTISLTSLENALTSERMQSSDWNYLSRCIDEVEGRYLPPKPITCDEALTYLQKIERGDITLSWESEPQTVYCGNVTYTTSDGATLVLFNDANEWDYLESITFKNGRSITYDLMAEDHPVSSYKPSEDAQWKVWGIPGYLHFRCRQCAKEINPPGWSGGHTLCVSCGGEAPPPERACPRCQRARHETEESKEVCHVCEMMDQIQSL